MNLRRFFSKTVPILPPQKPPVLPATFQKSLEQGADDRPAIFDPALTHFRKGFRRGDPQFGDPAIAAQWFLARRRIIAHLLHVLHDSPFRDHLVLRGSTLLKALLGDTSREPGDIDFVVTPESISLSSKWSQDLFATLPTLAAARPLPPGLHLDTHNSATDDIWTYDRSAGRRIVFPWHAETSTKKLKLPAATIQIDFTFSEPLWSPPVITPIPVPDAPPLQLLAATPEQSLAWKILWLESDTHPQGKDLYDATLLAEHFPIRLELIQKALEHAAGKPITHIPKDFPLHWQIDWQNFQPESHPALDGDAHLYQHRLLTALQPTLPKE